ncbi:hypothetical protein FZEAL_6042 [Fusarium zealandicum]|uniref:Uncharacterized protein n=1 Tax=Fusarium zealandicum TaxID=1053134 RepID=A0A8H4XJ93_9HYPO|nr:hypothetical protein FZEAL_6042 [Fusarium zealandicum]
MGPSKHQPSLTVGSNTASIAAEKMKMPLKSAAITKEAFVTPTKQCGPRVRGSSSRTNWKRSNPLFSSPADGEGVSTPDSIFSPGVSEVFSPPLDVSTPLSVCDYPGEFRRSRRSYKRREEESPTRQLPPSLKKLTINEGVSSTSPILISDDEDPYLGSDDEDGWVTANEYSMLETLISRGDGSSVDDDAIADPSDASNEHEEDEAQPAHYDGVHMTSLGVDQPRIKFERLQKRMLPLRRLHDRIVEGAKPDTAASGYIYYQGVVERTMGQVHK